MHRRWTILVLVVMAVGAATYIERWARPDEDPKAQCRPDAQEPVNPGRCTAGLSVQETFEWWQKARTRAGGDTLSSRQHCREFKSPKGPCSRESLLLLDASWLDWREARLAGVWLRDAERRARLPYANLAGAILVEVNAIDITIDGAILLRANFLGGDFSGANFTNGDLRHVNFAGVNLRDAGFNGANFEGLVYEPRGGNLPDVASLAGVRNLQAVTYRNSPVALSELREALYKAGLARQGQQITFAIERTRRIHDGWSLDPFEVLSSWGRLVAFEWTAGYGMNAFRPLLILLLLIPAFAPIYAWGSSQGRLWIRRPEGTINRRPFRHWVPVRRVVRRQGSGRLWRQAVAGLWFSVVCAFRIGYRDVNVGDWITRLQPDEYLLGATGWCRTVSGLQSLLSVYLLALTVLCIIGRPFG